MNTHDHDNDALPGDDELKALYRSLPRKEPPPAMDRAIKRAAADAVRGTARRSTPRWPVAVASAAMVVVAAGLGWRLMQQPSNVPQIPTASSASAAREPAIAAVQAPAPPPPASTVSAGVEPPAAKVARQVTTPLLSERENIRSAVRPKVMAHTVAPAPPPIAMESTAPALPAPQERAYAGSSPLPAPAPLAPPTQMQAAPAETSATVLARPASNAPMAGLSYRAAGVRAMAAPAPALPMPDATAANAGDTPAQELEKIRQLFAQQRREEAMQRLAAFQKAHPDLPLPDDLRAQLPDHE